MQKNLRNRKFATREHNPFELGPTITTPQPLTLECSEQGGVPVTHPEVVAWRNAVTVGGECSNATRKDVAPAFLPVN